MPNPERREGCQAGLNVCAIAVCMGGPVLRGCVHYDECRLEPSWNEEVGRLNAKGYVAYVHLGKDNPQVVTRVTKLRRGLRAANIFDK